MKCKASNIKEDDNCQAYRVQVNENADEIIFLVPDLHCCQLWSFSHSFEFTFKCVILAKAGSLGSESHPDTSNPCIPGQTAAMEKPCWLADRIP